MKKTMVIAAVTLVLGAGTVSVGAMGTTRASGGFEAEGSAAPDFRLRSIQNSTVCLGELKGKNVILFFFTTWCPYCRKKMPDLQKKMPEFQAKNIELLLIDVGESEGKMKSFAQKNQIGLDIFLDLDSSVAGDYGIVGVPTFVFVNQDGVIVAEEGELPYDYEAVFQKK